MWILGQSEVVKPLITKAAENSFIALLLTAIIIFIGVIVWYIVKRCFGKEGMLSLFIDDVRKSTKVNTETLSTLSKTSDRQVGNCDIHGKLLTQITAGTKKTNEKVEVVRTDVKALKAAVYDSVEVVRSVAGDFDDKITQNILLTCCDRIESRLRAGVE